MNIHDVYARAASTQQTSRLRCRLWQTKYIGIGSVQKPVRGGRDHRRGDARAGRRGRGHRRPLGAGRHKTSLIACKRNQTRPEPSSGVSGPSRADSRPAEWTYRLYTERRGWHAALDDRRQIPARRSLSQFPRRRRRSFRRSLSRWLRSARRRRRVVAVLDWRVGGRRRVRPTPSSANVVIYDSGIGTDSSLGSQCPS